MKSLFISLMLFLSISGMAQPDKRTASIRQQLAGLWQLDISADSASWEHKMHRIPNFQFLDGDRIALLKRNRIQIISYVIAFSSLDTFLIFPEISFKLKSNWNGYTWTINEIRYKKEEHYREEKLIKTGPSSPLPISLASAYALHDSPKDWTGYPSNTTIPDTVLELNEDYTFRWDSVGNGTWKLDSIQAILHFQTASEKLTYEILVQSSYKLVLRPIHSSNSDAILNFTTLHFTAEDREKLAILDSIRNSDSLAAVVAMEQGMFIMELESDPLNFGKKFKGTWEANLISTPESKSYSFVWNENGTLILRKGKKEKKYTWELISVEDDFVRLKLTRSGMEELGLLVLFADHVHHEITLINPFTGKLESFLLQRSE